MTQINAHILALVASRATEIGVPTNEGHAARYGGAGRPLRASRQGTLPAETEMPLAAILRGHKGASRRPLL